MKRLKLKQQETSKMKLAKALKVKNRLVGEVNRLRSIFQRENSREVGTSNVDVPALEVEMLKAMEKLIEMKTAITKANIGIYEKICRMDEIKSLKSFYASLNTVNGKVSRNNYSEVESFTEYEAYVKREAIDAIQKKYQEEIDALQDSIDEYNASTEVDVVV